MRLKFALFAAALLLTGPDIGRAQDDKSPASNPPLQSGAADHSTAPVFLLDPAAQIRGDKIKQETYRSQPTGQNLNWNLDIGRFQAPINDDPNHVASDLNDDYSGMRLRLPLRGGLGQ